jgi:glyoxylase-like metal-dependent hydrolase (beta-lactamase superfamily II)
MGRWSFGAVEITRVADPDFELVLAQDDDTTQALASRAWLSPDYVTADRSLRVGSSAVVVRTPSAILLVDPWLAFDDPARLAPRLAALRGAGIEPVEIDFVINTHVDGLGANVEADGSPTFPNARYLVPQADLDALAGQPERHPLLVLQDQGRVDGIKGDEHLLPGVHIEAAEGHSEGHVVVWITSGGEHAVITGHLFLHPAQIAAPDAANGDLDPLALAATRRQLLERCVDLDALLLGPLFAAPGGGRVRPDGSSWKLIPA